MNTQFYTNVIPRGNALVHYYVDVNGKRRTERIKYKPSLGVLAKKKTNVKDIHGKLVGVVDFQSISDMYSWRRETEAFTDIYGDVDPKYQFISEKYNYDIIPDYTKIKIYIIDIEVYSDKGFPLATQALHPVTAITIKDHYTNKFYVFGAKNYTVKDSNVQYFKCSDEYDLLDKFINFFRKERPDIISGWHIDGFDIPYLINRIKNLMPEGTYHKLSPLNEVSERTIKGEVYYDIIGITSADYLKLYKQFSSFTPQENYRLETVAQSELGEGKVDYHSEFRNLAELYEKDFEKYISYNIKDTELISQIEDKRKFFEVFIRLTYMNRILFNDTFGTVKPWDIRIYNELKAKGIITSPKKKDMTKYSFPGGFVFKPKPGHYRNIVVEDIVSSYPNQLISGNISPETLVNSRDLPPELRDLQEQIRKIDWRNNSDAYIVMDEIKPYTKLMQQYNVCLLANGEFFKTDVEGFLPKIFNHDFKLRRIKKNNKKEVGKYIDSHKNVLNNEERNKLSQKKSSLDVLQQALKIFLNSGYGALANVAFRYSNVKLASAVTCQGQLCIKIVSKGIEEKFPMIKNIYSDTDSVFFDLSDILKEYSNDKQLTKKDELEFLKDFTNKAINPEIERIYVDMCETLNMFKNTYVMEFEAVADSSIFVSKKRYVMRLTHKDGVDQDMSNLPLKIRGIEVVRSNTPKVIRKELKDMLKVILETTDNDSCIDKLNEYKEIFFKLPFEKIARPTGINGLKKYQGVTKGVPIHVRAAKIYNKALDAFSLENEQRINEGDKILYCYIKTPNLFQSNVIACIDKMPEKIKKVLVIDHETQFQKTMLSPLKHIFDSMKWETEKLAKVEDEWF